MDLMKKLWIKAKEDKKRIVLPEGEEERIILASSKILEEGLANLIIIGDKDIIENKASTLNVDLSRALIINPKTSDKKDMYAKELYELRKYKGMTLEKARELMLDNTYFGTMMVKMNEADGLVSGSIHTTAETIRPALQIIKTAPQVSIVSSFFIMITPNKELGADGVLLFADCALNQNPNAEQLSTISIDTAKSAIKLCDINPKVALLSFSTKGSAEHESITKIVQALDIIKNNNSNLEVDGELQLDAAIIPEVALRKSPNSKVAGYANVLIFPDLNAGNIGYKLVERFGNAQAIGPICQGFAKPVNDLSRGCSIDDIIQTVVVTAVQAQGSQ